MSFSGRGQGLALSVIFGGEEPVIMAAVLHLPACEVINRGSEALCGGSGWASSIPHGTIVGKVTVHNQDGETAEIPIRAGVEVRDWFLSNQGRRQVSDGERVWVQASPEVSQREIGVYLMTSENPRPEPVIRSLDDESTMTDAVPFLLGITVEGEPAGGE